MPAVSFSSMHNIQFTEFKVSCHHNFENTARHSSVLCRVFSAHMESPRSLMLELIRESHPQMSIWRTHLIAPARVCLLMETELLELTECPLLLLFFQLFNGLIEQLGLLD